MKTFPSVCFAVLIFCVVSGFALTQAAELGQQMKIGQTVLILNGAGSRSKTFIELYESGLYLERPSADAAAILAGNQPMAIRVQIRSSFVSKSALAASLNEGLEKSTGGDTTAIRQEIQKFHECLEEDVKKNDVFDFIYSPAKGLYVVKNGTVKGIVPGLPFKKALFGVWLSPNPVDASLKQAMLSAPSRR